MSLYEFRCETCNHKDIHEGFNGPPEEPECTVCGNKDMKRLYGFATTGMPTQAGRKMGRK